MPISNFSGKSIPTDSDTTFGKNPPVNTSANPANFSHPDVLINYNTKFASSSPALYRDKETSQLLSILIGKTKPNALLVGPAGVGKNKIIENLARMIAEDDQLVPPALVGSTIYELPLSAIMSRSGIVGALETNMNEIIDFACDPDNHAIIFIDEFHQIFSGSESYNRIAELLKPALARGDMHVIGATTIQEAQSIIIDNPALSRRFSKVVVDELSSSITTCITREFATDLIKHYGNKLVIPDHVIDKVTDIADQYRTPGSHRPDTSITLLDRTCAQAIVDRQAKVASVAGRPDLLDVFNCAPTVTINEKMVRHMAMKLMTGAKNDTNMDVDILRDRLRAIHGQDKPVAKIIEAMSRTASNLFPDPTPTTLLFAGKSGVGKTQAAKIIAHSLTGCDPITLNMTEFNSSSSINRIIGAPQGYVGYDSKAELPFDILDTNPLQVILLDEFEKAHRSVQRLFMSAFDEGFFKTSRGKIVDFSHAIIIATTNASHTTGSHAIGFSADKDESQKHSEQIDRLSEFFDIELLNRFNYIITFNSLESNDFAQIIRDLYAANLNRLRITHRHVANKLPDEIGDDVLRDLVAQHFKPKLGARPAKHAVRTYIESLLS